MSSTQNFLFFLERSSPPPSPSYPRHHSETVSFSVGVLLLHSFLNHKRFFICSGYTILVVPYHPFFPEPSPPGVFSGHWDKKKAFENLHVYFLLKDRGNLPKFYPFPVPSGPLYSWYLGTVPYSFYVSLHFTQVMTLLIQSSVWEIHPPFYPSIKSNPLYPLMFWVQGPSRTFPSSSPNIKWTMSFSMVVEEPVGRSSSFPFETGSVEPS